MTRKPRSVEVLPSCLFIPETADVLAKKGIKWNLQTEAAAERFNELRESMPVGGLVAAISSRLVQRYRSFGFIAAMFDAVSTRLAK